MIHFELIFVKDLRSVSNSFFFFCLGIFNFFQHHLLKGKLNYPISTELSLLLCQKSVDYNFESVSGLSSVFH